MAVRKQELIVLEIYGSWKNHNGVSTTGVDIKKYMDKYSNEKW